MSDVFDPSQLTYAQLASKQVRENLCGHCRHQHVCPVPIDLKHRQDWFLAITNCGHYEKERHHGNGTPSTDG